MIKFILILSRIRIHSRVQSCHIDIPIPSVCVSVWDILVLCQNG